MSHKIGACEILFLGGGSFIPALRKIIKEEFDKFDLVKVKEPLNWVSKGCAIYVQN